jgi:hypothetical protein
VVPVSVKLGEQLGLLQLSITDRDDHPLNNFNNLFTVTSNDSNFFVQSNVADKNLFSFNFRGKLNYNVNTAHIYVVELTATDTGVPSKSSKALVYIPVSNFNMNPPSFDSPVILTAATTLPVGSQIGILNAWDLDGDAVSFSLVRSSDNNMVDVMPNGSVILKSSLNKSINLTVRLEDDGSSCGPSNLSRIRQHSDMPVTIKIFEVNMHSPRYFINT